MKIVKANQSINAGSVEIKETSFDSARERVGQLPSGAPTTMVDFVKEGKVIATLGSSGLSFATLADESNKAVGLVVSIKDDETSANFVIPSKGGTIKSIEKDMKPVLPGLMASAKQAAREFAQRIIGGQKVYQPIIAGWKAADFVRA